jgi:hypothetical protein
MKQCKELARCLEDWKFTYVTDTDVFDNLRVDLALVQHLHHNLV